MAISNILKTLGIPTYVFQNELRSYLLPYKIMIGIVVFVIIFNFIVSCVILFLQIQNMKKIN